jgi:hypothetical protein
MTNQKEKKTEQGTSWSFYFVIGIIALGLLLVVSKLVIGF